jgi:hypothetical protein
MAEFFKAVLRAFRKHRTAGIIVLVLAIAMGFLFSLFEQWFQNLVMDLMGSHARAVSMWMLAHPAGASAVIVSIFTILCLFIATRDEVIRKYVEFVREPDIPVLEIIWKPGEHKFVHHYLLPPDPVVNVEFRFCVINMSKRTTLKDIRVRLQDLEPHELPCVPCGLRLMNDLPSDEESFIHRFDLHPGDEQFISFIVHKPKASYFWILHTTPRIPWAIPAQQYTMRIVASCESTRISQRFEMVKNGPQWDMRAIDG